MTDGQMTEDKGHETNYVRIGKDTTHNGFYRVVFSTYIMLSLE